MQFLVSKNLNLLYHVLRKKTFRAVTVSPNPVHILPVFVSLFCHLFCESSENRKVLFIVFQ